MVESGLIKHCLEVIPNRESRLDTLMTMKATLEFTELRSWQAFENLVAEYFRQTKGEKNIIDVEVQPSGVGGDGGRDILVTFEMTDSIRTFKRKWVVQCKFYDAVVSKSKLDKINIPTLIHEHKADGYLLICKGEVSSTVSLMFETLSRDCGLGYSYTIWTGEQLKSMIQVKPLLVKQFFPKHHAYVQAQERKLPK